MAIFIGQQVVADWNGDNTSGNDTIIGTAGNDYFDAGLGVDYVNAGAGNDTMVDAGGMDGDVYDGGTGTDTLFYTGGGTFNFLNNPSADIISNIEWLIFDNAAGNNVTLANGNQNASGGAGLDIIRGGDGTNWLLGGAGDDQLFGGAGGDRLEGGTGRDFLAGGTGTDILTGGADADAFVFDFFESLTGNDSVTDFNPVDDYCFLTNYGPSGAFFNVGDDTSGSGASAFLLYDTGSGQLFWDANGKTAGGLQTVALFSNTPTLTAADFIFAV